MANEITSALSKDAIEKAFQNSQERAAAAAANGNYVKVNYIKLDRAGDYYYHVLPPWPGNTTGLPYYEMYIHFMRDENNKALAYRCSKMQESQCPICDVQNVLYHSSNPDEKARAKDLRANKSFYYNVISNKGDVGVLQAKPTLHDEILCELREDLAAGFDPTAYTNGLMLKITRTGSTWNTTKYKARSERQRCSFTPEIAAAHGELPKLDEVNEIFTSAELAEVLKGNFDPKGRRKNAAMKTAQLPTTTAPTTAIAPSPQANVISRASNTTVQHSVDVAPVIKTEVDSPVVIPSASAGVKNAPDYNEALRILGMSPNE